MKYTYKISRVSLINLIFKEVYFIIVSVHVCVCMIIHMGHGVCVFVCVIIQMGHGVCVHVHMYVCDNTHGIWSACVRMSVCACV